MEFFGDDRAVTVQIGAILLFAILIISLAMFQVSVIPDQNEAIEFKHNLNAQQGMSEVRNALLSAASSGDPQSAIIPLGTTYPQRTLFVNPPPASGTIRTDGTGDTRVNVTINNADARSTYDNAETYWNGTARTYNTGAVVYTPNYNEYSEAPTTVYEHTLVTNVFSENRTLEQTGQTLIRGNRINLLTVNGSLQENGVTAQTVDTRPLSSYTNSVTVESTKTDPLWINLTTRLDNETWGDEILLQQRTTNGGNVAEVVEISTDTRNGVTYYRVGIRMKPGRYQLRGASVAVGTVSEANKQPKPTYFVVTDGYDEVENGSTGSVTVEVRDQFNNPVDGFEVNGTLDSNHLRFVNESGAEVNTTSVVSDEDGEATFTYKAINETTGSQTAWLNVSMLGPSEEYHYTNVSGREVPGVVIGDDGGDGGNTNPGGSAGEVVLTGAETGGGNGKDLAILTLTNTDTDAVNLTNGRIEFYYTDSSKEYVEGALANGSYTNANQFPANPAGVMEIGGSYVSFQPEIQLTPGDTKVTLEFRQDGGGNRDIRDADFFIVSFVFEVDGETERYRYFVNPET
jgi:hypothetical protein